MGRASSASSSWSSIDSNNYSSSTSSFSHLKRDLTTDLRLGLSISQQHNPNYNTRRSLPLMDEIVAEENESNENVTLYVKVYMEGHPIGRKIDVLAHDGYEDFIATLHHMFNTNILWGAEVDEGHCKDFHVLTYEDEEGDWMIVGDVPWEMFLSTVRRLKISKAYPPVDF